MPNQCIHCSAMYADDSVEVLEGCSNCGGKFFFYLSKEKFEKLKEKKNEVLELGESEKNKIERDVREIAGIEESEAPIVLDFESVKVLRPGKYLIDLHNLFSRERPLVYKLEDGKYIIDLAANLAKRKSI